MQGYPISQSDSAAKHFSNRAFQKSVDASTGNLVVPDPIDAEELNKRGFLVARFSKFEEISEVRTPALPALPASVRSRTIATWPLWLLGMASVAAHPTQQCLSYACHSPCRSALAVPPFPPCTSTLTCARCCTSPTTVASTPSHRCRRSRRMALQSIPAPRVPCLDPWSVTQRAVAAAAHAVGVSLQARACRSKRG